MYKKPDGKLGFSFGRALTNAIPNFANDNAAGDATLTAKHQDDIFAYQMTLENPKVFNDLSLYAFGVVEMKSQSSSVLHTLKKIGIVDKTDGSIHTDLITKHFPNQLPTISVHRQRRLVSVLFFWEEELVRWRLLDEEEAEIRAAMETHGAEHEDLKVALGTVWVKRSAPPSRRGGEDGGPSGGGVGVGRESVSGPSGTKAGEEVEGQEQEPPPDYGDIVRTVSISGGKYHEGEAGSSSGGGGNAAVGADEKRGKDEGGG